MIPKEDSRTDEAGYGAERRRLTGGWLILAAFVRVCATRMATSEYLALRLSASPSTARRDRDRACAFVRAGTRVCVTGSVELSGDGQMRSDTRTLWEERINLLKWRVRATRQPHSAAVKKTKWGGDDQRLLG